MRRNIRLVAALLAALPAVNLAASLANNLAAAAAPAVSCAVADYSLTLDLFLPLETDGTGGAARGGMKGTLEIHHQKVARDRRRWALDGRQPSMLWNVDKDFRIRLVLATGENLVDLVIETQLRAASGNHAGTFRLLTSEGVKVQGRIECSVG